MSTGIDWSSLKFIYNHSCDRCSLGETARNICVRGRGKFGDRLLFVAEAPGEQEDRMGLAMVGKAGKIFDHALAQIGMTEEDYYVTNIVKCRPPQNRKPKGVEVKLCATYLWKEIKVLDPEYIILLGSSAIKALFGNGASVRDYRGKVSEWNGYKVFATLHPSSVSYEPYNLNLIMDDLNILVRHMNGKTAEAVKYHYSKTNSGLTKLDDLGETIAVDIETTGLDFFDPEFRILSIALSDQPKTGHGILLNHKESVTEWSQDFQEVCNVLHPRCLVGHNFKFDLGGLRSQGFNFKGQSYDTMIMAHLLDENNPDKSLETLAMRDTDMGAYKSSVRAERKDSALEKLSVDALLHYNCQDVDATIRLFRKYWKQLEEQGMIELLEFNMDLSRMLGDIEYAGWMIDVPAYRKLKAEYDQRILELREKIHEYSGEINLNSNKQKAKFIYEDLGFKILKTTKTGDPACDKASLMELQWHATPKRRAIIDMLLKYTTLVKRRGFFDQIKDNRKSDGKVHASYKQTKSSWGDTDENGGTVTGRLSCKNPNIQQIPREGDIKCLFVSQWEDGKILQLDYSQMELRVLAEISGDRKMLGIFEDDSIDIHRRVASWPGVYNKPESEVTDAERKFTKRVNFGISYMIGPQGLARSLSELVGRHVPEAEAKRLIDGWFSEFTGVKLWIEQTRKELIFKGEITTPFTRKRRLAETSPNTAKGREGIRQGVNFVIQSMASDICLYRAVEFWKWLKANKKKTQIVALVHDSVVTDCYPGEEVSIAKAMKRIFENGDFSKDFGFSLRVPLRIDINIGSSWADKGEINV